jgi:hypothetical protein
MVIQPMVRATHSPLMHPKSKGLTMQQETIKDYATALVVGIIGALALLHSLDALFY